jgi:hypothetical protein
MQIIPAFNLAYQHVGDHPIVAQPDGAKEYGLLCRSLAINSAKKRKEFEATVVERLGKGLPKIETSMDKALAIRKKVHAEIQLLYHYA